MVISQVDQTSSYLKFCPLGHLHVGIFFTFNPREVWNNKSSNDSVYNWVQVMYSCNKEEKSDVTKIPIFEIYGMGWYIQKDQDEKSPLAKNQPISGDWWGDISTHLLWWLHTNHPEIGLDLAMAILAICSKRCQETVSVTTINVILIGWFSNRKGTSVDDGARKLKNWLDQWQSGKLGTGSHV